LQNFHKIPFLSLVLLQLNLVNFQFRQVTATLPITLTTIAITVFLFSVSLFIFSCTSVKLNLYSLFINWLFWVWYQYQSRDSVQFHEDKKYSKERKNSSTLALPLSHLLPLMLRFPPESPLIHLLSGTLSIHFIQMHIPSMNIVHDFIVASRPWGLILVPPYSS